MSRLLSSNAAAAISTGRPNLRLPLLAGARGLASGFRCALGRPLPEPRTFRGLPRPLGAAGCGGVLLPASDPLSDIYMRISAYINHRPQFCFPRERLTPCWTPHTRHVLFHYRIFLICKISLQMLIKLAFPISSDILTSDSISWELVLLNLPLNRSKYLPNTIHVV
jgi:hypothetical protein